MPPRRAAARAPPSDDMDVDVLSDLSSAPEDSPPPPPATTTARNTRASGKRATAAAAAASAPATTKRRRNGRPAASSSSPTPAQDDAAASSDLSDVPDPPSSASAGEPSSPESDEEVAAPPAKRTRRSRRSSDSNTNKYDSEDSFLAADSDDDLYAGKSSAKPATAAARRRAKGKAGASAKSTPAASPTKTAAAKGKGKGKGKAKPAPKFVPCLLDDPIAMGPMNRAHRRALAAADAATRGTNGAEADDEDDDLDYDEDDDLLDPDEERKLAELLADPVVASRMQAAERQARAWWYPFPRHPPFSALDDANGRPKKKLKKRRGKPSAAAVAAAAAASGMSTSDFVGKGKGKAKARKSASPNGGDGGGGGSDGGGSDDDEDDDEIEFVDDEDEDSLANGRPGDAENDEMPLLYLGSETCLHSTRLPMPLEGLDDEGYFVGDELPVLGEFTMHQEPVLRVSHRQRRHPDPHGHIFAYHIYGAYHRRSAKRVPVMFRKSAPADGWTPAAVAAAVSRPDDFSAIVGRDPEYRNELTGAYFFRRCVYPFAFWRLAADAPYKDADPADERETKPDPDARKLLHRFVRADSAGDHFMTCEPKGAPRFFLGIRESMLPFLHVVVRPVRNARYKRGQARFRYRWMAYLRIDAVRAALRDRPAGVTTTLRKLLDLFRPGWSRAHVAAAGGNDEAAAEYMPRGYSQYYDSISGSDTDARAAARINADDFRSASEPDSESEPDSDNSDEELDIYTLFHSEGNLVERMRRARERVERKEQRRLARMQRRAQEAAERAAAQAAAEADRAAGGAGASGPSGPDGGEGGPSGEGADGGEPQGDDSNKAPELTIPEVQNAEFVRDPAAGPSPLDRALEEFRLQLYPYQKRTIDWLMRLENDVAQQRVAVPEQAEGAPRFVRLGPNGHLYHFGEHAFYRRDRWTPMLDPPPPPIECPGAIDASRVGAGKTVTALALVVANPLRHAADLRIPAAERGKYVPSSATLVVVRSDLVNQWRDEAAKALPRSATVVTITTIAEWRALSWNAVITATLVIVSSAFLANANYRAAIAALIGEPKYQSPIDPIAHTVGLRRSLSEAERFARSLAEHIADLTRSGRAAFGEQRGSVVLERIYFHRVIVDEMHEFVDMNMVNPRRRGGYGEENEDDDEDDEDARAGSRRRPAVKISAAVRRLGVETRAFIKGVRTRFILGLTGSPVLDGTAAIPRLAELIHARNVPHQHRAAHQAFLNQFFRRANPDLHLPPVRYATIWVHLTPTELALAAAAAHRDRATQLQALQHHGLAGEIAGGGNGNGQEDMGMVSAEEMSKRVQADRLVRMARFRAAIATRSQEIDSLRAQIGEILTAWPAARRWALGRGLRADDLPAAPPVAAGASQSQSQSQSQQQAPMSPQSQQPQQPAASHAETGSATVLPATMPAETVRLIRDRVRHFLDARALHDQAAQDLREVAAAHAFLDTVLGSVARAEEFSCPICFDSPEKNEEVAMTMPCGHLYCVPCSMQLRSLDGSRCAVCRAHVDAFSRTRMGGDAKADGDAASASAEQAAADARKYGQKVLALIKYVQRVVAQDPTAKLILFCQFRRLAKLISQAFHTLGVENASLLGGNVMSKRRALSAFKQNPDVKVLFLSNQDCVSGLHLTEANHVVIVHPFLAEDEATSRAYETQGIARAVRAGQTREVTVVRFVSRGTLEEELTQNRVMAAGEQVVELDESGEPVVPAAVAAVAATAAASSTSE
ncbi:hypothetical protein H9P43_008249 [Blastocladiella emersonii ATCC 22665]|nr:hypothetical protein H9P43_008249 [Blastocladiella emersonii ATCC 22665]